MSVRASESTRRPRAPKRDTQVVVGAMILLSVLAWLHVLSTPSGAMTRGVLTGSGDVMAMDAMSMPAVSLPLFLAMWVVMMVAMMFPAVAPVVLLFDRWRRSRARPVGATAGFVAGYLAVWTLAGLLAFASIVLLDGRLPSTPSAVRVGGVVLVIAGVYQLTPLKSACLTQCRSPLGLIMEHAQRLGRGVRGPLEVGVRHGAYCLGCCWALMAVLIALGVMNIGWMAAVAVVILAEKVLPGGRITASVVGVGLIAAGVAFITTGVGVMA